MRISSLTLIRCYHAAVGTLALSVMPGVMVAQNWGQVTLEESVRTAMERHEDVGQARAAAEAVNARIREVRSQALPEVQIVSNAMRWRDPSMLNASGLDKFPDELRSALVPSGVNVFDYSVTFKQLLFAQGRVGKALRLASIEAEGSGLDIERAQQDVALGTVRAFYDLLWAERYRSLLVETQKQKELHADMARTRYRHGVATEVDVLRSDVSVANGIPDLVRAENGIKQARALLNYYLGRPLDFPTQLVGDFQQKQWEQTDVAELEREAVRLRPELQRLRVAERSAGARVELAKAENGIRLDLSAGYGVASRLPENLLNSTFTRWTVGIHLTFPVFDGFRRSSLVRQATANERGAKLECEKVEQQIRLAIQQGYNELKAAEKTIAAATASVRQAETVLGMMQNNYNNGAATTLDIVDAQTAVSVARTNLLRGMRDYSVARANLRWSVGQRPWE